MKCITLKNGLVLAIVIFFLSLVNQVSGAEIQSTELIKLKTRPSITLKIALIKPDNPVASVIFFKGGKGLFELKSFFGKISAGQGKKLFDMLKRDFATKGLAVGIVDAPSDKSNGIDPFFRRSKEHAQDIEAIVSCLVEKTKLPVWLFGHSFGTLSAAHGTIHIPVGIDGLVLASPVTRTIKDWGEIYDTNPNGIIDMDLGKIRVPTLLVFHKDDKCIGSPPTNIPRLRKAIEVSKAMELTGGKTSKIKPCGPLSAHSFFGIEKQFFSTIAEFIKSKSK